MAYISLAELKSYLRITDTGDDSILSDAAAQAQAIIDAKTGKTFEASSDTTRYFDATLDVCGAVLRFDKPIAQITSITNGDGTVVTSSQYVTEPRNTAPYYAARLLASTGLSWTFVDDPENAIMVTGRWAYSVTAPADIRRAALRLAAWLYKQMENYTPALDQPTVTQDGVMLMPMDLPRDVQALLRPYLERL